MSNLIPFTFENTSVRMFEEDGKVFFCGKDVATALGYTNTNKALADHCKGVTKRYPLQTAGGVQQVRFITEGDLYRLIASSKLPSAQAFEAKVFDEVLPTIRKTGAYGAPKRLTGRELMAAALIEAEQTLKALESKNKELAPKAESFDHFLSSNDDYSVREAAQILCRAGVKTGQNRLFNTLEEREWVYKPKGHKHWRVYQYPVDRGFMNVKTGNWMNQDTGETYLTKTPRITPKGIYKLAKHFGVTITEEDLTK